MTVTRPADTLIEIAQDIVEGRIEDDNTEQARKRSLGMVLAGVGRTLATDAVDVIGDRFVRHPTTAQATVGGQAVDLEAIRSAGTDGTRRVWRIGSPGRLAWRWARRWRAGTGSSGRCAARCGAR